MSKVVAIDGPAGSGKGTITPIIASRCHLVTIDTGATYRCVALAALNNNLSIDDKDKIIELSGKINIEFDDQGRVYLDGEDVSKRIREKDVTSIVSPISSIVEVRANMVDLQRKMAEGKDVIMEGRDITTVVFPNADYKFYLDASLEERARRRFEQNKEKGIDMSYEEVLDSIQKRDYNDMHKEVGSLMRTEDAIYIDTTNMSIDEVVEQMINIIEGD